jgi:hypothetical protein
MSKLMKLKKWLSLDDAVVYLSKILEESVSTIDLYQLAIDGHLVLSVHFINPYSAKTGDVVDYKEIQTVPSLCGEYQVCISTWLDEELDPKLSRFFNKNEGISYLDGVWDLYLGAGAANLYLQSLRQRESTESNITSTALDGIFVTNETGDYAELYEKDGENEYPATTLPTDCQLVIRVSSMQDLIKLAEEPEPKSNSKAIDPRIESSYQRIIAALLSVIDGTAPINGYVNDSQLIAKLAEHYAGYSGLSKRNLEKRFPQCRKSID